MSERSERFDKFTERARKVLSLAHEEAARLKHNYIGTEHLLLGLVREGDGVAARVLRDLGVSLGAVRGGVEHIIGRGDRSPRGEIGLTPRARRVIESAFDEARRQSHYYIGTEHLLLGLLREREGIASGILESLGVNLEQARKTVIRIINQGASFAGPSEPSSLLVPMPYGHRFTGKARRAVHLAQGEAASLGAQYVGTSHLLLGIVLEGTGGAAEVLLHHGTQLTKLRTAIEAGIAEQGPSDPGIVQRLLAMLVEQMEAASISQDQAVVQDLEARRRGLLQLLEVLESAEGGEESGVTPTTLWWTHEASRALRSAVELADEHYHPYVGTGHLLSTLLEQGETGAATVLRESGVDPEAVQAEVTVIIESL